MLGRFLEFSATTQDIQGSMEFYETLGFSQAEVGAAWAHPYAVMTDGRIHVGLHQQDMAPPSITFVKPGLLKHLEVLERIGVEFQYRRLGNDVFNEVGWLDPFGHTIRLVEARTFSPAKRLPSQVSACGYFVEIGLPAQNLAHAKAYWERFGFVGMDEPLARLPHVACTSDTIDLGLYESAYLRRPTLLFDADDVDERIARLAALGIEPAGGAAAPMRHTSVAVYVAPEGTQILMASSPAA